jgi:GT2 family glycosyltransferase
VTIIFCIPGKEFSDRFLNSWTDTITTFRERGAEAYLRTKYTSNVYLCRNQLLRHDNLAGQNQGDIKPFPNIAYDWLMWIDSDMVWEPSDVDKLIAKDKDIITGLAITDPISSRLNFGACDGDGRIKFWHKKDLKDLPRSGDGLIEAGFAGFGFILVKRGVFESMSFPWFKPTMIQRGNEIYFPSEDITWSLRAVDLGWKIWADPEVCVGHEKPAVLRVPKDGERLTIGAV